MATSFVKKMTLTYAPLTGYLFVDILVALTEKEW